MKKFSKETVQAKMAKTAAAMETTTEFAIILLEDEVLEELGWTAVAGVTGVVVPVLAVGGLVVWVLCNMTLGWYKTRDYGKLTSSLAWWS